MLTATTQLYLTDKTGAKFFKTVCSTQYKDAEKRNLARHIENAKVFPSQYKFLDVATVRIIEEQVSA